MHYLLQCAWKLHTVLITTTTTKIFISKSCIKKKKVFQQGRKPPVKYHLVLHFKAIAEKYRSTEFEHRDKKHL